MRDRGRREALALFAMLAVALMVFGGVTVLRGGEPADESSDARTLEPFPTAPGIRWKHDVASLFGPEFRGARVAVEAAADDILVVSARPSTWGERWGILALDPDTGRPLWKAPRTGWDDGCALSRNGRLACTRLLRERGVVVTRVSFVDRSTGEDISTAIIRTSGPSTITGTAGGFLVRTLEMENIGVPEEFSESDRKYVAVTTFGRPPDQQVMLTMFDSEGRGLWAARPPLNHAELVVSEAGDMVAVGDRIDGGFTVYRLDNGKTLVSVQGGANDQSDSAPDTVVLHRSGFVTSSRHAGGRVEFFDSRGMKTGEMSGWRVVQSTFADAAMTGDGDELTLESQSALGIASIASRRMRWEVRTPQPHDPPELLDKRYLAIKSDEYSPESLIRQKWTVFDNDSGERKAELMLGFGQGYLGFDGTRMLFTGEPEMDQRPNIPTLTAYDVESGAQMWRLPSPSATARWHISAPYLLLIESGEGGVPVSIARYSA